MDGAYVALRGYKFQFDKTIFEIFSNPKKKVSIEQAQDLGIDDYLIQVKYHDTVYTAPQQKALIKKPLIGLIDQFLLDKSKKYILFIYIKGISPSKTIFSTVLELNDIIGNKTSYTAPLKNEFIKNFTLVYADDFELQYKNVIQSIRAAYSKSQDEAEMYYAIISGYLLEIVTNNPPSAKASREVDKAAIDKLIENGKRVIFKSAFADILTKERQLHFLRRTFFKQELNTESFERFFIIETNSTGSIALFKEMVLVIKNRWSKNKLASIPDTDRFAPYIFFNGMNPTDLVMLKQELQVDGYVIRDGYDFMGAKFNVKSIVERPTFANKIFFKMVNAKADLHELILHITKTKVIYQFYFSNPLPLITNGKEVSIEIQDLNDIKNII